LGRKEKISAGDPKYNQILKFGTEKTHVEATMGGKSSTSEKAYQSQSWHRELNIIAEKRFGRNGSDK